MPAIQLNGQQNGPEPDIDSEVPRNKAMAKKQKYETVFYFRVLALKKLQRRNTKLLSNYKHLNSSSLLTLNWLLVCKGS